MTARIDHLVIAATDLAWLEQWWVDLSGTAATSGGAHDGRGTKNSLAGLASSAHPTTYLELIGPDPDQPDPGMPRSFGIDQLEPESAKLVTFAVSVDDLEVATATVASLGLEPGPILEMSRVRPDGVRLEWRLAVPDPAVHGGVQPFLIEWGDTPHPSASLPGDAALVALAIVSPTPDPLRAMFDALGLRIGVGDGDRPMLGAHIQGPTGRFDLGAS